MSHIRLWITEGSKEITCSILDDSTSLALPFTHSREHINCGYLYAGHLSEWNCTGFFVPRQSISSSCLSNPAATFNERMAKRSKCGSGSLWEGYGEWGKRWRRVGERWVGSWSVLRVRISLHRVIKKGEDRKQVCCGLAATAYASWHHSLTKCDDVFSNLI